MVNFLALLGWSPGTDQELFTPSELIGSFSLEGISGGNAVFNPEKLDWFNQQYLMRLAPEELAARLKPWFEDAGLWRDDLMSSRHAWFFSVLELPLRPRAKRLGDFVVQARLFLDEAVEYGPAAVDKHLRPAGQPTISRRSSQRSTICLRSTPSRRRPRAARAGGGAWYEGGADSRRACRRHGKNGKSGSVRRARAGWPRTDARARRGGASSGFLSRPTDSSTVFPPANLLKPWGFVAWPVLFPLSPRDRLGSRGKRFPIPICKSFYC
ncbi:MAG: hypothetical protein U0163_16235 [Gemmatimonadaceae bacterium]